MSGRPGIISKAHHYCEMRLNASFSADRAGVGCLAALFEGEQAQPSPCKERQAGTKVIIIKVDPRATLFRKWTRSEMIVAGGSKRKRCGLALGNDHDSGALAPITQPERRERSIAPTTSLGSLRGGRANIRESGSSAPQGSGLRHRSIIHAPLEFDVSGPQNTYMFSTT